MTMKQSRHEMILHLITNQNVATQEDMRQLLLDHGYEVTQATVSRDIKALQLNKVQGQNGQYKYAVMQTKSDELVLRFQNIFVQSVVSADYAGNTLCIRCFSGMANAACAAFDSMEWDGLVGTLAGDDTIFALCRTEGYASQMKDAIKRLLQQKQMYPS